MPRVASLRSGARVETSHLFINAVIAACCSPIAFLDEGRSCTCAHQADNFGRPSNGPLAPNIGKMLVIMKMVGVRAASAMVNALPAAHGLPIIPSS